MTIRVAGGGPAGTAAAIAARLNGASVEIYERHSSCRHKVCGEFLSPYCAELLASLDAWSDFLIPGPQKIVRSVLHLGRHTKSWNLFEAAWGLSRLALDRLLLDKAVRLGAVLRAGHSFPVDERAGPLVQATGRPSGSTVSDRFFGFKAHYNGPVCDTVELFFHDHGYAGVSCVEDGITNVCGLAPESVLRRYDFNFDELLLDRGPLRERLRPLSRAIDWVTTGPLAFSPPLRTAPAHTYPAGDSLGFVDPYTGSGIMNALLTGRLAGEAAARNIATADYLKSCHCALQLPYRFSTMLRYIANHAAAHWLIRLVPGEVLFRLTRA